MDAQHGTGISASIQRRGMSRFLTNDIQVEVETIKGNVSANGRSVNVNTVGICGIFDTPLPLSERVYFNMKFPDSEKKCAYEGKVIWRSSVGEKQFVCGIRFLELENTNISSPLLEYIETSSLRLARDERRGIERNSKENKRQSERMYNDTLSIEIELPFPKGCTIVKPIIEITDKGLSFYMSEDEGFFEEGMVLKNIKIFNREHESNIRICKVTYCQIYEIEGMRKYKVGVMFLSEEDIYKKRAKRFQDTVINNLKSKVSFMVGEEEHRAQLLNFSKYGISLLVKSPHFVIKKSEILKNINISIKDMNVYKGDGLIVDVEQKNDSIKFRIALKEGVIPVDEILSTSNKSKIDFVLSKLTNVMSVGDNLPDEFKQQVKEVFYELTNIKRILDEFEENIRDEEPKIKEKFSLEMMTVLEKNFFQKINIHFKTIHTLTRNMREEEYSLCGQYFQNAFKDLIFLSPFMHRVYYKPLGYAGDYEMMNMLYRNTPQGKTLFAKFLDKYFLSIDPAQTNRNRVPYMTGKIKNKTPLFLNKSNRVKISSIACGPCIEIQTLLQESLSDNIDFTLLDASSEAIDHAKHKLEMAKNKHKRKCTFTYINESIYPLIKKKSVQDLIEDNQHIIYSLGLFEYLSDITIKRLLKILFNKLAPGGLLIAGNYSDSNVFQTYMELGGEWFLFYRKPEKMLSFVDDIVDSKAYIDDDGMIEFNKFLNIEKVERG